MENIERTQFVVLTGHLDDQPLPDLIRTLRVQRKSGRLQVEYADSPGAFFFEDGQLVDARLGTLRGVEAVYAALSLGGASFNFNPLVRPPERSIDRQEQKFLSDLVEAPRREGMPEIRLAGTTAAAAPQAMPAPQEGAPLQLAPMPAELLAPLEERLTAVEAAIVDSSRRLSRERLVYAVVISFLVGLAVVLAVQAIFNPFPTETAPVAARTAQNPGAAALAPGAQAARSLSSGTEVSQSSLTSGADAARSGTATPVKKEQDGAERVERGRDAAASQGAATVLAKKSERVTEQAQTPKQALAAARDARKASGASPTRGEQVVQVFVKIKDGLVTDARVLNSRPGANAAEARALAEARQRRYLNKFTGGEILSIRVKP